MTDSRLSTNSFAVLTLLERLGEGSSYDVEIAARSLSGIWPLSHTTAYSEPARLETLGYLASRRDPEGRRRRSYSATEKGREALREWRGEPTVAPPTLRDEALLKAYSQGDSARMRERALECAELSISAAAKALGRP